MKSMFATLAVLVIVASAANANAQVFVGPAIAPPVAAPAVFVPPPAPVVAYYPAPVVAYTPGYVFSAGPILPAPLYYSVRQRTYFRGPYFRTTVRYRGW